MKRAFFKCDGCALALHLLGPVDRPCPNCGGVFVETEEEIHHPMQIVDAEISNKSYKSRKEWAADVAAQEIDGVMEGFDLLLAEAARNL